GIPVLATYRSDRRTCDVCRFRICFGSRRRRLPPASFAESARAACALHGAEQNGLADAFTPVVFRLSEHARDQIDIHLRESDRLHEVIGAINFLGAMPTPVLLQNLVAEILTP